MLVGDFAGARRGLAPGPFLGPLAASGDGGVLAIAGEFADEPDDVVRATIVRVGANGSLTPLMHARARRSGDLGNGTGSRCSPTTPNRRNRPQDRSRPLATAPFSSPTTNPGAAGHRPAHVDPSRERAATVALRQDGSPTHTRNGRPRRNSSRSVSVRRDLRAEPDPRGAKHRRGGTLTLDSPPPTAVAFGRGSRPTAAAAAARRRSRTSTPGVCCLCASPWRTEGGVRVSDGDEGARTARLGACGRDAPRNVRCLFSFHREPPLRRPRRRRLAPRHPADRLDNGDPANDGIHAELRPPPRPRSRSLLPTTAAATNTSPCGYVPAPRHTSCRGAPPAGANGERGAHRHPAAATRRSWSPRSPRRRAHRSRSRTAGVCAARSLCAHVGLKYSPAPEGHRFPIVVRR